MPDLDFKVTGVEAAARGMTPLLQFALEVTASPPEEPIQSAILQAQIQFQCPRRAYNADEKEKLVDLFGTPERWGQTLRNRLWTHSNFTLGPFTGATPARLQVACTFDLNVGAAKYFDALEGGDVPLLFLFSGTVFYSTQDGRLQVQRVSHEKECTWRMPASTWRELMDHHWPNTAWIVLHRDLFDRLNAYKRRSGCPDWDQALDRLLTGAETPEPALPTPLL
ncbi:MAG TPA: DUF6084 family protein [Chthoniobacteraceae bacterium]|nr:DUF6084 family protein [Chthoniobacteraceae bacterium]